MARFTYHGPVQTISIAVGKTKILGTAEKDEVEVSRFKDIDLAPGQETPDLPEKNPIILSMIDAKLLVAVKTDKPAKSTAEK